MQSWTEQLHIHTAAKSLQSCPTLCDPMDYTVHGILQARILEWVVFSLLQGIFPNPGIKPRSPALQADSLLSAAAADAAAKLLQSCPTLCDPIDGSPLGSFVPGILQARTLEWVATSFSNAWKRKVKVTSLSRVWLSDPMTAAYQAPPSMGFSREEYWNGLPLPCFTVWHRIKCSVSRHSRRHQTELQIQSASHQYTLILTK